MEGERLEGVVAGEHHQVAVREWAGDQEAVLPAGAQALQDEAHVAAAGVAQVEGQLLQRHLLGAHARRL
ncbi:hypothetical protein [Streptomyces sp. Tu 3180]|uniref:hypothetical protein n=1 Tax=Streptomyces sp. Tu 3180 TaxID=2682611 RepID=UPI00135A6C66|nr:hypothetical protein [Streptomyces sp. Tu 3180]KAF3470082.1 hypothetical protein GL259_00875 [Streptomyces sp. Tu 3180]